MVGSEVPADLPLVGVGVLLPLAELGVEDVDVAQAPVQALPGEVMGYGTSPLDPVQGVATTLGMGLLTAGMRFGPTPAVVDRMFPKPGEGPCEETRCKGHFRMEIHARTSSGAKYVGVVAAHHDPRYDGTSVMLTESALCLALDSDQLPPEPACSHRQRPWGSGWWSGCGGSGSNSP